MAVHVRRWWRYGHDRLYVNGADGRRLSWHDLITGTDHVSAPEYASLVRSAVGDWLAQRGGTQANPSMPPAEQPSPVQLATPPTEATGTAAATPWVDLADRPAGAMALAKADEVRATAPRRGFWGWLFGVPAPDRSWRVGAEGEMLVGRELGMLTTRNPWWHCLHAVPVGTDGSDIDHVVIGPAGVFTLNTKHHPRKRIWVGGNTFMVNGTRTQYVRNARHEAARATRLLSARCGFPVQVRAVIVVVAASLTIREAPPDVAVVSRRRLRRWLQRQPEVLPPDALTSIYAAARRSDTWTRR